MRGFGIAKIIQRVHPHHDDVPQNLNDKDEITEANKSIQQGLVSKEEERLCSQKMEERTELDLLQDEVDWAKRSLEEAHLEIQAVQDEVIETAFRLGQTMEKMSQIMKLLEANLESVDQWRQVRKTLLDDIKKTKTMWEKRCETIKEEEKLQSNKDDAVQCIDFCEVTTSDVHAILFVLRGGILVSFQVFRGAYILLRISADTKSQETQDFLRRSEDSRVCLSWVILSSWLPMSRQPVYSKSRDDRQNLWVAS